MPLHSWELVHNISLEPTIIIYSKRGQINHFDKYSQPASHCSDLLQAVATLTFFVSGAEKIRTDPTLTAALSFTRVIETQLQSLEFQKKESREWPQDVSSERKLLSENLSLKNSHWRLSHVSDLRVVGDLWYDTGSHWTERVLWRCNF